MTRDDVAWGSRDEVRRVPLFLPADLPVARILAWTTVLATGVLFWAGVGVVLSLML